MGHPILYLQPNEVVVEDKGILQRIKEQPKSSEDIWTIPLTSIHHLFSVFLLYFGVIKA
jgi:hypothetical protein